MNNSAAKVGEIFREAGTAFNKLSEMTLMLQPTDDSPPGGKWSDAEVEMLRGCINRFAVELNKISQHIKNRTMRHLKCLLKMDSGTIEDISSSPQYLQQQPQPAQEHILETESQCDLNETFVNIFSQGFPEQVKDEDIDQFLRHFDPSVVNSTPPVDFMEEDRSQQHPASEFEDLQDSSYDRTLQAVPSLISLLDADVNNANYSERKNSTELGMANIGTLHAEFPNFGCNLGEAPGASSNFQEVNSNNTSLVSREAHFSLRQAQDTLQDSSYDRTLQAVPGLISLLDADVNTANYSERKNSTELGMANIGTLHAEFPNFGCNLGEATGASSNFQDVNSNNTSLVSREAHFSLRQAQDTWNHVSSPATNQTMVVPFKSEGNFIIYTGSNGQTTSVQASDETALTEKKRVNENQYRPHDTVSGLLTQKTLWPGSFDNYSLPNNPFRSAQTPKHNLMEDRKNTQQKIIEKPRNILYPGFFKSHSLFGNLLANNINKTMPQAKPRDNILCPGSFRSLNNDPFGIVQAPNEKLEKGGSSNMISSNLFGNSLYSANPEPVKNFSSIRAVTNKQALASSAHLTCECKGRGRSRRRRKAKQEAADPIISPPEECTAKPNHRLTTSRHRQEYYEIEKPDTKCSRKKATTKSTASSRTKAQKKKLSPT